MCYFIRSAAFVFIFADLLMLLTLITFMLGAPMERFVCRAITDPSLTQLEKVNIKLCIECSGILQYAVAVWLFIVWN